MNKIIILITILGSIISGQINYYTEIEPILTGNCGGCHTTGNSSGFNLASYNNLMSTGNHGPVVIPFDGANSILIQKLGPNPPFGNQMPQNGPLPQETIDFISQWIDEGALEYPAVDTLVPPALVINEFLAKNDSCCTDEAGEYDDYIEIYNAGDTIVVLDGMYLTDDLSEPTKFMIPYSLNDSANFSLNPGEFQLFWADDDSAQGINHLSFKLSGSGEQIGLFMLDGETAVDTLNYHVQFSDVSYGRFPDGSDSWIYANPTPGFSNINELAVDEQSFIPQKVVLNPSYPNPFNPTTTIQFNVGPGSGNHISIQIIDSRGRYIDTIVDGHFYDGQYKAIWNAASYSSGIYFVQLESGNFNLTQKIVYLK